MNRLLLPSGSNLDETHCRRWLALRLLRDLDDNNSEETNGTPLVDIQISQFLETQERFVTFGFARPLALSPKVGSSVVVGFKITPELKETIHFVEDPAIPNVIIHETCERCPLGDDQCNVRGAEATILRKEKQRAKRKAALGELMAELQK